MKHGVGIHTSCKCGDTLRETLELVKAAGFEHVMLVETAESLSDRIKLTKELGLNIPYVHLAYHPPCCPCVNNLWKKGDAREAIIKHLIDQIKICDEYCIPAVCLHLTYGPSEINGEHKIGIGSIKRILKATEECCIKLAFENLEFPENLSAILDNIKHERIGFCYDNAHHYLHAPDIDFMGKYGGRCFAVHLHDNLMKFDNTAVDNGDLHLLPFDGKIDFDKVIWDIARSNYSGPIMLESKRHRAGGFEYDRLSPTEFLRESFKRAVKLADMRETKEGSR